MVCIANIFQQAPPNSTHKPLTCQASSKAVSSLHELKLHSFKALYKLTDIYYKCFTWERVTLHPPVVQWDNPWKIFPAVLVSPFVFSLRNRRVI